MAHLSLDPACLPLWRDVSTLQLGLEGAIRIEGPTLWQERLLARLVDGFDEEEPGLAAAFGVAERELRAFLRRIAPALRREAAPAALHIVTADGVEPATVTALCDALTACGWAPEWVTVAAVAPRVPAVLVAHHAVAPSAWVPFLREDVVHAPLVFSVESAEVGPVVRPGRSPCLGCLAAHERERDPAWPVLTLQLLARRAPQTPTPLVVSAATLLSELLRASRADDDTARSARLSADGRRRWRSHRHHAECLCRSPRGSETAPAAYVPMPSRGATTATAIARRA